jgi:hypothetical protein
LFDSVRILKNETLTALDLVKDAPGAIWDEIHNDYKAHPLLKASETVASFVAGAALYVGMRKAPVFMKDAGMAFTLATAPLTYQQLKEQTQKMWSNGGALWRAAEHADSGEQREKLAQSYSKKLGKDVAPLVETGAPMFVGGIAADRLLALAPSVDGFLTENIMNNSENRFSESKYRIWSKGGFVNRASFAADDLRARILSSASFINGDGTQDLLAASDCFNRKGAGLMNKFWLSREPGAEVGREINMPRGTMSAPYRGTEDAVSTGSDLRQTTTAHTHPEGRGPGASPVDVVKQKGVSFIQSGELRGFYAGQLDTYEAGIKAGLSEEELIAQHGAPRLFELILDDNKYDPHAFYITREAERLPSGQYTWKEGSPTYVDYEKAKQFLSHAPTDAGGFENMARELPHSESPPSGGSYFRNLRIATLKALDDAETFSKKLVHSFVTSD